MKKLPYSFIKEQVENVYGYKLISDTYVSGKEKLELICPYGHECKISWEGLKRGRGCKYCKGEKIRKAKVTPQEMIIRYFEENDYRFIRWLTDYRGHKTNCELICPNGHQYVTRFDVFKRGNRCKTCYLENNGGENCHFWKGGITNIHVYLRGKLSEWKNKTAQRANYKCDISGLPYEEIHHLYGFSNILEEVFKTTGIPVYESISDYSENELKCLVNTTLILHDKYGLGVCLTESIHSKFHSIYGKNNNTPEQYYEFKSSFLVK